MISYSEQQLLLWYLTEDRPLPEHLIGPEADVARRWIVSYQFEYKEKPDPKLLNDKFGFALPERLAPYDELVRNLTVTKARVAVKEIQEKILGDAGKDPLQALEAMIAKGQEVIASLSSSRSVLRFSEYEEMLKEYVALRAEGVLPRVANFGFPTLDQELNGLERGDLAILYARYGDGKSTIASQCAVNALRDNKRVLYLTLEEDPKIKMKLIYSLYANIDSRPFTRMAMPAEEFTAFKKKLRESSQFTGDIIVPEKPIGSIGELLGYLADESPDYFILDQLTNLVKSFDYKDMSQAIYRINNEVCLATMIPGIVLTQANTGGKIGYADAIGQAATKVIKVGPDPEEVTEKKKMTILKNKRGAANIDVYLNWELENGLVEETDFVPVNALEERKKKQSRPSKPTRIDYKSKADQDDNDGLEW